jgi:hypothetical protein
MAEAASVCQEVLWSFVLDNQLIFNVIRRPQLAKMTGLAPFLRKLSCGGIIGYASLAGNGRRKNPAWQGKSSAREESHKRLESALKKVIKNNG